MDFCPMSLPHKHRSPFSFISLQEVNTLEAQGENLLAQTGMGLAGSQLNEKQLFYPESTPTPLYKCLWRVPSLATPLACASQNLALGGCPSRASIHSTWGTCTGSCGVRPSCPNLDGGSCRNQPSWGSASSTVKHGGWGHFRMMMCTLHEAYFTGHSALSNVILLDHHSSLLLGLYLHF